MKKPYLGRKSVVNEDVWLRSIGGYPLRFALFATAVSLSE